MVLLGSPSPAPPCKKQYILSLSPSLSDLFLMSPLTLLIFVTFRIKFEDDDDLGPSEKHDQEYYCDDPQLPIYSQMTSGYAVGALINLLMTEMKRSKICTVRPHGVSENATFVIDLDEVRFCDLRSDDLGSWTATGTKSTWFRLTNAGIRISEKKPPASELGNYYVLTRRYYVHSTYHLYHRIISDIKGMYTH